MPSLTEFDRGAIRKLLNEANQIRRRSRMKIAQDKSAAPMLSQAGNVLKSSGIEHRAEIVKRILMKGKPLNPAVKAGSAPPTSSHHEGPVRKRGKIETPQDDTNPKLAELLKSGLVRPPAPKIPRTGPFPVAPRPQGMAREVEQKAVLPMRGGGGQKMLMPFSQWTGAGKPRMAAEQAREILKQALSAQMIRSVTGGKTMPAAQALKQVRQPAPPPPPRPTTTEHELAKRRRAGVVMTAEDARAILKLALNGKTG